MRPGCAQRSPWASNRSLRVGARVANAVSSRKYGSGFEPHLEGLRVDRPDTELLGVVGLTCVELLRVLKAVEQVRILRARGWREHPPPGVDEIRGRERLPVAPLRLPQMEGVDRTSLGQIPSLGDAWNGAERLRVEGREPFEQGHGDGVARHAGHEDGVEGLGLRAVVVDQALQGRERHVERLGERLVGEDFGDFVCGERRRGLAAPGEEDGRPQGEKKDGGAHHHPADPALRAVHSRLLEGSGRILARRSGGVKHTPTSASPAEESGLFARSPVS